MPLTFGDGTAIFSIKPKYLKLIFSGNKSVELRRTHPRQISQGSFILFWESSPNRRLAGAAKVVSIIRIPVEDLWENISELAGISREEFDDYFKGIEEGIALFFENPVEFSDKPQLETLRRSIGFLPPQSFRYISKNEAKYFKSNDLLSG